MSFLSHSHVFWYFFFQDFLSCLGDWNTRWKHDTSDLWCLGECGAGWESMVGTEWGDRTAQGGSRAWARQGLGKAGRRRAGRRGSGWCRTAWGRAGPGQGRGAGGVSLTVPPLVDGAAFLILLCVVPFRRFLLWENALFAFGWHCSFPFPSWRRPFSFSFSLGLVLLRCLGAWFIASFRLFSHYFHVCGLVSCHLSFRFCCSVLFFFPFSAFSFIVLIILVIIMNMFMLLFHFSFFLEKEGEGR